ncbi:MAG: hypothetical protein K1Y36_22065 [Blastocatellia bacterium]|nr:hypothetical protein [Blastocatellia bacterium]
MKFSPDGKRLVSADSNGIIKVWDVGARKHLTTFTTTGAQPSRQSVADLDATGSLTSTNLNFANNDDQVLVATKDGFLRTFSITGELLRKQFFGFGDSWVVLHLSPDGETVVAGGETELKVFNRPSGKLRYQKSETCGGINHIAFSRNGAGFVACCGGFPDQPKSGMILYQTDSGLIQQQFGRNSVPVRCADFFPDGQMFVSVDFSLRQNEGILRLWDCASGQSVGMVKADEKAVQTVKVTPDGKRVLSGGLDGRIRCWKLKD